MPARGQACVSRHRLLHGATGHVSLDRNKAKQTSTNPLTGGTQKPRGNALKRRNRNTIVSHPLLPSVYQALAIASRFPHILPARQYQPLYPASQPASQPAALGLIYTILYP